MWEGERIEVLTAGQARGAHRRDQVVHEAEVGEALLKRRDSLPHQAPGRPNLPRHPQRVRSLGGYPPQGWRVAVEVYPWVSHQGRHRRNEANVGHCRGRKRQGHQRSLAAHPGGLILPSSTLFPSSPQKHPNLFVARGWSKKGFESHLVWVDESTIFKLTSCCVVGVFGWRELFGVIWDPSLLS